MRITAFTSFSTTVAALVEGRIDWSLLEDENALFFFGCGREFFYTTEETASYADLFGRYSREHAKPVLTRLRSIVRNAAMAGRVGFRRPDNPDMPDFGWRWLADQLTAKGMDLRLERWDVHSLAHEFPRMLATGDKTNLAFLQRRAREAGWQLIDPVVDAVPA